jgi:hypothetical protein
MKLFQDIASIQPKLMGWCSPVKAATLASAVLALRPAVVVEVGVFGGSSFIPLALALKEIGQGIAYGIDPWSAPASADGQLNPADLEYWSKQETHDVVYNDFMRQTQQLDLGPFINIQRRKSDDADIPDTPTTAEAGLPGFILDGWFALFAPAGTPQPIIDRLNAAMRKIARMDITKERASQLGTVLKDWTAAEMDTFARSEVAAWGKVIRDNNITMD